MPSQRILSVTGAAASHLLRLTVTSDTLLPLKRVASSAIDISDLIRNFKSNKKEWQQFHVHLQDTVATIIDSLAKVDISRSEIRTKLENLQSELEDMIKLVESKQRQNRLVRALHFMEHPEIIADMMAKLDNIIDAFMLGSVVRTELSTGKTVKILEDHSQLLEQVHSTALNTTLNKLQYVKGASWDRHRVCLPGTRIKVIEGIISWINNSSGTNIFLLTGVAGSGKSTIAHTIAQLCALNKQLVTSFFFDCGTEDRNNPRHLISTITTDICRKDRNFAGRVSSIIEDDESLACAPISRQFEELILQLSEGLLAKDSYVIVLDALDEGRNVDLLQILCNDVPRLPVGFHLFITSRVYPELVMLRQKSHVRSLELDIHGQENMQDMALFIPHQLKRVAEFHEICGEWPTQSLVTSLEDRAGGLFLWVATICDYLCTRSDPTHELRELTTASTLVSSAEAKMDRLYATILRACDWSDQAFVGDYQRLMGAAVATKTPLTFSTLSKLYERSPLVSSLVLRYLSPLLTGLGRPQHTSHPVRLLHQSLRDFLTLRAMGSVENVVFSIDEKAHSQALAYLCIRHMNSSLNDSTPGVGYLAKVESEEPGVPSIREGSVSEELLYACRFWIDHILDVQLMSPTLSEELEEFLKTKLVVWMELVAVCGRYEGILRWIEWGEKPSCDLYTFCINGCTALIGSKLTDLAKHLMYMDRREEALTAARDAVMVYQHLAKTSLDESRPALANSLCDYSYYLSELGHAENALIKSNEAVDMYRQLEKEYPNVFTADLAKSLHRSSVSLSRRGCHEEVLVRIQEAADIYRTRGAGDLVADLAHSLDTLSTCLSNLSRQDEALTTVQDSVEIRRRLAKNNQASHKSNLAQSLQSLSTHLSNLGHHKEALTAIQEAVKICRHLAKDRPAAYIPELAHSLHSLSVYLSNLGYHKEALVTIEETIEFRRKLAEVRPAAFIPELSHSLHNLSVYLSNMGLHEEAMAAVQEAVGIRRTLRDHLPVVFAPDLAHSLHSLSVYLSNLGRYEEALETIREAIEIRRSLVAKRPAAYIPDLAHSLNSISTYLSHLGFHEDALTKIKESIEFRRQLAIGRPASHAPGLAHSLHNLSVKLFNLGHHTEALLTIREAIEIRQQLVANRPVVFIPQLAHSRHNLSLYLFNLGQHEEALTTIQEVVEARRKLAIECPAVFAPHLAHSLHNTSLYLSKLGRHKEALTAILEAVETRRQLVASNPSAFSPDLAISLSSLAARLSRLGHHEETLNPIEEAVEIYRQLTQQQSVVFAPNFAHSLRDYSAYLSKLGLDERALASATESVDLYRSLSTDHPNQYIEELSASLRRLSSALSATGASEKALLVSKEAEAIITQ